PCAKAGRSFLFPKCQYPLPPGRLIQEVHGIFSVGFNHGKRVKCKENARFCNILVHSVLWISIFEGGKIMSFLFSGGKGKSSIHAGFGIGAF
ncbi:MAG: hypothetical protein J7K11_06120, partial [Candidatus Hydrothermae bacterium]|nr:hypothetical protein [Candidatus Hydrothermae bacterium]